MFENQGLMMGNEEDIVGNHKRTINILEEIRDVLRKGQSKGTS